MSGAFQTSREIFDNPIWKNITEFRIFFLIYGKAIFAEEGYRVSDDLHLERGQWLRSTRKIQDDLEFIENRQVKKYSTATINRCIKSLVTSQRLCTKMHELGTVYTVVNYEMYQGFGGYRKDNLEQNLEQSRNSSETVAKQTRNNNKKENKVIKDNKVKKEITYSDDFEIFWNCYPKQIGKPAAFNNWKKLIRTIEPDYLKACSMNYASYVMANNTELQFIKQPNNFLNAKDEYYKQFETPVLIHNKGGQAFKGKPSVTSKIQEMYNKALEEEKREANGGY